MELREALASVTLDAVAVAHEIVTLTEAHGAFPVLHVLHAHVEARSAPAMIARLALACEAGDVPVKLQRALDGYLQFHPEVPSYPGHQTWMDVLRSDGRSVTVTE